MISTITFPQRLKLKLSLIIFFSAIYLNTQAQGGTATPTPASVCSGQSSVIKLTGHQITSSIRWQRDSAGTFVYIYPLETKDSLVTPPLTSESKYRAMVSTSGGNFDDSSSVATVTVDPVPDAGTTSPPSLSLCSGEGTTIKLNGATSTIQWQSKTTGAFTDISGETQVTLETGNLITTTYYQAVVTLGSCSDTSTISEIIVNPIPETGPAVGDTTLCSGNSTTLSLPNFSENGAQITWQYKTTGDFTDLNAHNSTYNTGNLTETTIYRAYAVKNNCSDTSNIVTVTVNPTPDPGTTSPATTTLCSGQGISISLNGATNLATIQWQSKTTGAFTDIGGAMSSPLATGSLTETTHYQAVVTLGSCSATSTVADVIVNPIPSPGTALGDTTICSGNPTTLTLKGSENGAQITWQVKNSGGFTDLNAHNTTYATGNLTSTTIYRAYVVKDNCSDTSNIVTVTVNPGVDAGTATPANSSICSGGNTSINLTGATNLATIQWQSNASGSFADINGATSSPLATDTLTTTTQYQAVVTLGNCSAISSIATVNVNAIPSPGTVTAGDTTLCNNKPTTLTLSNSESGAQITWQIKTTGGFSDLNAHNTTYATGNLTETTSYRAYVKKAGCSDTSNIVTIKVNPSYVGGTTSAVKYTVCAGDSTVLTLSGSSGSPIQWRSKTGSGPFTNIPGANGLTLNTHGLSATTTFRALVGVFGCTVPSTDVTITVNPTPVGGTITSTETLPICTGKLAHLKLNGSTGTIRWQNDDLGTFNDISGETDPQLTTPNLTKTTQYRAILSNDECANDTSTTINITIAPQSQGGEAYATPSAICNNQTTVIKLKNSVGNDIQWQKQTTGGFANIALGRNDTIFTTPNLTVNTNYRALVTNSNCAQATSDPASVSIYPVSDGGQATADTTLICSGANTRIVLKDYAGTIQWQSDASGTFTNIPNANSSIYNVVNLTKTTSFKAVVTSNNCTPSESNVVKITIATTLPGTASANPSPICSGAYSVLKLQGHTTGAKIFWQKWTSGSFVTISGAVNEEYTTVNLTEDTKYRALVQVGNCTPVPSNEITVTILPTLQGGEVTANPSTICSGTSTTISLNGNSGTYVWQQDTGSGFANIPGAAANTDYATPNLTVNTKYRAYVSGGSCASVYSDTAIVTIIPASKGGKAKATKTTVCSGTNTTVTLNSNTGIIQWQVDNSGSGNGAFVDVPASPSSQSNTYVTPNLTQKTRYRAKVTNSNCLPAYSDTATIDVSPASIAGTISPSAASICQGGTVTFTLNGSAGTVQWQSDTANHVFANISGTGTTYTTFPITKKTLFRAVVTNGTCTSAYTDTVGVSIAPSLSGGKAIAIPSTICSGTNTTIRLRNYTGNIQWQTNASGNFQDIPNAKDTIYTTPNLSVQTKYRAVLSSGTCPTVISEEATVSILSASAGGIAKAANTAICSGASTTITLSQYVGAIQWQLDSASGFKNIVGANGPVLNTGNLTTNTTFRAVVTSNGCAPANSTTEFISVTPASFGGTATPVQSNICSGGTATINLTNEIGTQIQWQYDSLGTWVNISGATGKPFTTSPLTQQTRFRARVRNGNCNMSSSTVATIYITPTLLGGTAKATPSSICSGTTTTIKLTGHTGSQIQWQSSTGSGYTDIANEKDTILVTPLLTTATNFRARVNGSGCPQVLSSVATVNVIPVSVSGTVTATPSIICSGETSVLTLNGNVGNIQWQSDESGVFSDIVGQKGQSYSTPALNNSTSYRAVVKNGVCPDVKTAAVTVTVNPSSVSGFAKATPPTVCNGGVSKITLTSYVGDKFQWQKDSAGTYVNIVGATDPDYTTPSLMQNTTYRVIVTKGDCAPAVSNSVPVTITNVLNGGLATAVNPTICKGTYATIKLTGQMGSIQWQTDNGGGSFKDIVINGNGNTLITPNLTVNTKYRAVLSSGGCTPEYSNVVQINIIPSSVGGTATPKYPTVCSGETDTIKLTGNVGSIQWQIDSAGTFVNILNATGSFYVTPPLTVSTTYRAMVTSSGCAPDPSVSAVVSVAPASKGGVVTASATKICSNATTTLTLNGYVGSVQWQSDAINGSFQDLPGATGMSFTTTPINQPTHFRAMVTNGNCPSVPSTVVYITLTPELTGGTTSANPATVCSGTSTTLTLKGHSGAVKWQTSVSNTWIDIDTVMATDTFYVTPALFYETKYRALVSSKGCASKTSTETIIAVAPASKAGSAVAATASICKGETTIINLSGFTGTIQWQVKDTTGKFKNIPLATSNSYTTLALTQTTSYRAVVTNGLCSSDTSNVVIISIIPPSEGGIPVATAPTVCIGGTTTITLTQYTGDKIKWQRDSASLFVDIPGAVGPVYSTPSLGVPTTYRAVVSNKGCHTVTSPPITILVTSQLEGGTASVSPVTVCENSATTLYLKNYKGSIQWRKDTIINTVTSFVDIPGATTTPYTTKPLTRLTQFYAMVSSGNCPTVYSNFVQAYVTQKLNAGIITANPSTICSGESIKLKINGHTGNVQWQEYVAGKFVDIPGETADTCRIPVVLQNNYYRAKISSGACDPVFADSILVSVTVIATPSGDSVQQFCSLQLPTIKNLVIKDAGTDTIKWYSTPIGGVPLSGSTTLVDNGVYYAARAAYGCETYKRLKVKVVVFKSATVASHPSSQTTCPGSNAQFVVKGDGTGLTYKWMVDMTGTGSNYKPITDNSTYKGSTTDTLKISNVTNSFNSYSYKCILKGTCSSADSVSSNAAILLVSSNTTIDQQPQSLTMCYGDIADFHIKASGNNSLTYQWQVDSTNTNTFVNLKADTVFTNTTNDSMRIRAFTPKMATYKFRCVVTNVICGTATNSQEAIIVFDEECNVYPVDVPTGFSPDGDGVNDKLVIQGLENYPGSVVRVFNIWGDLVYEKEDYQNDWDAKANVKNVVGEGKLPAGTYYIYVDLKKGAKRKATFLIIKY